VSPSRAGDPDQTADVSLIYSGPGNSRRAEQARSRGGGIRTHGLFVPNDGDEGIWLTRASDGNNGKLAAYSHFPVNFLLSSAMAVDRENVLNCVRTES
ncbi:MAG: hypothetical protein QOE41_3052, partial [Mycobacterium sp.]|nr:hypothetical protein [Mycobacterium sp.]